MNKKLKLQLIKEGQKILIENPQNWAHEITHHFRVWETAKKIVREEKLEILSRDRFNLVLEAEMAGEKNLGVNYNVVKVIRDDWLPVMPKRYHFSISRKIHSKKLETILPIIEKYLSEHS